MKIVLIGQAAFGEKVLAALLEKGEQVVGVFCPPDPPDKPGPLKQLADSRGIPVYQFKPMRQPEAYGAYAALEPDLTVMAFVTDIIPERFFTLPRLGTIQYHPSLLPKHRGGSAINWAIIQGDPETGLTIFWPDAGIDTGPILLQKRVEIGADDTTGSLYFNQLFPLGVEALVEAVGMVKNGAAPRIPQDELQATYEPLCTEERAVIDWTQPVEKVYNLIRGCNPQPGALTMFRGTKLKIYDCQKVDTAAAAAPGEVTRVEVDSFSVAAGRGELVIRRVQPEGQAKIKSADFIATSGLQAGERLG